MDEHQREDRDVEAPTFRLMHAADRLDSLAETASLMGDHDGSLRFCNQAATARLRAMTLLDDGDRG